MMIWMTMNLKKDFILAFFDHGLFAFTRILRAFIIKSPPLGGLSYYNILFIKRNCKQILITFPQRISYHHVPYAQYELY